MTERASLSPSARPGARPRLLVVTTDFPPSRGGIQRVLDELTRRLADRWQITVVAPHEAGARSFDGVASFEVVRTRAAWTGSRPAVLAEMTQLIARRRFDLILAGHVNTLPAVFFARRGAPTVAMIHGSELWSQPSRTVTRLLGRTLTRAMAVSRFTAAEAAKAGIPRGRVVVTPLGAGAPTARLEPLEVLRRHGLEQDGEPTPFFLTVSRLSEPHKGHDVFLRALPIVLDRYPAVKYAIAGEGSMAGELSALADNLGIQDAVRMLGDVDELSKAALMGACRAFVMPSRQSRRPPLFEGFGIVYIEAAIQGRPAIAGASGGIADAVVHGQTGLLVDPTSVEQVAAAAIRMLDDPEYATTLGQQARERALRDYTWSASIGRMERCMEMLL